jgi:hypothetical protein
MSLGSISKQNTENPGGNIKINHSAHKTMSYHFHLNRNTAASHHYSKCSQVNYQTPLAFPGSETYTFISMLFASPLRRPVVVRTPVGFVAAKFD